MCKSWLLLIVDFAVRHSFVGEIEWQKIHGHIHSAMPIL